MNFEAMPEQNPVSRPERGEVKITLENLKNPEGQGLYRERAINLRVEDIISQLSETKKENIEKVAKGLGKEGGARQMLKENLEGRFNSFFATKFKNIEEEKITDLEDFEKGLNKEFNQAEKDILKYRA